MPHEALHQWAESGGGTMGEQLINLKGEQYFERAADG